MNDHSHVMTPEEWDENKDCRLKKRDHKWQWVLDPVTKMPSHDQAVCVHCGIVVNLNRDDMQQVAKP